jgi:hypothetical protein
MEQDRTTRSDAVHIAWMWARVGDSERTIQHLQRAFRERSLGLVFLAVLPEFSEVRNDARVKAILEAMRLRRVHDTN